MDTGAARMTAEAHGSTTTEARGKTTAEARRLEALSWMWLGIGAVGFVFIGWKYNVPAASWLAPIFLIRFFRDRARWPATLIAVPALAVASFIQMNGGWDMHPWMMYLACLLRPIAFVAALYADRALYRRLPTAAATLVYPAVYLVVDYLIALTPMGSGMSMSATQLGLPVVSQLASVTGIWGIGFLIGWIAAVVNAAWDARRSGARAAVRSGAGAVVPVAAGVLVLVVGFGSGRLALDRPAAPTVRIGSVTIEHPRDYWAWIDQSTPRDLVAGYAGELAAITDRLFAQSQRAVAAGARIIFWSEGNAVLTQDTESAFMERAAAFAKDHGVYLAPAMVVLRYGQTISDNKIVLFRPDGSRAFTYVKTMSWYPTGSDGVLKTEPTPYGRLGAAICFDMDFPSFIHRLGVERADIVLVPAFDRKPIRPYHTEVGVLRGIENGFSVVRQTNQGTSMAMDGVGHLLARQEFFETNDRLMISDVPTRRVPTPYAALGEWFACAGMALALTLVAWGALRRPTGP